MDSYCDSCVEAALEDGMPEHAEDCLALFGADIADHTCDTIEDESVACNCACH